MCKSLYPSLINSPVVKRQMEITSSHSLTCTKRQQLSLINQCQDQSHKAWGQGCKEGKQGQKDHSLNGLLMLMGPFLFI